METATSLVNCHCSLGEGIFWDAREGHLWWVDVPDAIKALPFRSFERQSFDL